MIDASRYVTGEMTDEEERKRTVRTARDVIKRIVTELEGATHDDINNVTNANAVMAYYAVVEAGIGNPQ